MAIEQVRYNQHREKSRPGKDVPSPATHRNEFPAEYSLAGCSPAEPASALSAILILWSKASVRRDKNGGRKESVKFSRVSQKGAVHLRTAGSSDAWFRHFESLDI